MVVGNVPREVLEENLKKARYEKVRLDKVLHDKPKFRRNKYVLKVSKALDELIETLEVKLKEEE